MFGELVDAATRARLAELGRAADKTSEAEMRVHNDKAGQILQLLSILILDLGKLESEPRITLAQLKALLESIAQYFSWRLTDDYAEARKAEESLVLQIASRWGVEILPIADALGLRGWELREDMHGAEWRALVQRLRDIVNPKFASWIINRFKRDSDFVNAQLHSPERGYRIRALLLDKDGPLWKNCRDEMMATLDCASSNDTVRGNAYGFLEWIEYLFRRGESDAASAADLLTDKEIALALWRAATSQRLNPRAVGSLKSLYARLRANGVEWQDPEWWSRTVADLEKRYPKEE